MEVECPVDGCDYQDAVRSVKAHITASKDGDHDGMHGMDVADSLREQAEARLNGELPRLDEARSAVVDAADGVLTEPGSASDEPDEPAQAGVGPEPADEPDEAGPVPATEPGNEPGEPEVEPVEEIEIGEADDTDNGGELGIPVPVDANYIVIGVAVLVAILVFQSRSGSTGSEEPDGSDAPRDGVVVKGEGLVR